MARRKRLTRKEMKQDKFILFLYGAGDLLVNHVREIIIVAGVVGLSAMAGYWYSASRQSRYEAAAKVLAPARIALQQGRYTDAIPILEQARKDYGDTPSAVDAALDLANAYFQTGKAAEAQALYQEYLDKYKDEDKILTISALAGIAACREQQKQYPEAARTYRQLAETYPDSFLAPQFLLDAGRCYRAAADTAQAKAMYDQIVTAYADSRYIQDAKTALAAL